MTELSIEDARRLALRAQGFGEPRLNGAAASVEDIRRVFERVKLVQIDPLNVVAKAQYMPFYARLGAYDPELLHAYAYDQRNSFEYWVHEACIVPVEHFPLIRRRFNQSQVERRWQQFLEEHASFETEIVGEVSRRGALSVSDLDLKGPKVGHWGTSPGKLALYYLHRKGRLMVSDRRKPSPAYDLIERVVPAAQLNGEMMSEESEREELCLMAVDAHGVATLVDVGDYFRIRRPLLKATLARLVASGRLVELSAEGVEQTLYALPDWERHLEPVGARALLSPFDSLVWTRDRIKWLFDFYYRIEIYVPARKRRWGYYVLPFLMDETLVARVDVKCDRKAGVLRVPGAFAEPGHDSDRVAQELARELHELADWLGMERVVIGRRGDFVSPLRSAVKEAASRR